MPEEKGCSQPTAPAVKKRKSLFFRLMLIFLIAFFLQIPLLSVLCLNMFRLAAQKAVDTELSEKWGDPQIVSGPLVSLSRDDMYKMLRPEHCRAEVELMPEVRYRGIYQCVLYRGKVRFTGTIPVPKGEKITEKATFFIGNNARRRTQYQGTINGKPLNFIFQKSDSCTGLLADIPETERGAEKFDFDITLTFQGSHSFGMNPAGDRNDVQIHSTWTSPGFSGFLLPESRKIDKHGFQASWLIDNETFPTYLFKTGNDTSQMPICVNLVLSAGTYRQSLRALMYSFLFILMFLFSLLVAERIGKIDMTNLQYLIAAMAPGIFYLLLIAFGELIGFTLGYWLSAGVVLLLSGGYAAIVFQSRRAALGISAVLLLSYWAMFSILQMERLALLAGSIVAVIILAMLMWATARMNQDSNK